MQNIVKNLERQEVRDWLQNTREILEGEKKVKENITDTKTRIKTKHMKCNFLYGSPARVLWVKTTNIRIEKLRESSKKVCDLDDNPPPPSPPSLSCFRHKILKYQSVPLSKLS